MGNIIFNNNRIQDEEETIKVYLDLNLTRLKLNQNLQGKVIFKIPKSIQGHFDLNLKINGIENAYYDFKEKNKSIYKYTVKDHEFFQKTISLVQNEIIYGDQYDYVEFNWNPNVLIPSLDYQHSQDLKISREYMVEAILICKNQRNKKIIQTCQQRVLFYIDSDEQKQNAKLMKNPQVNQNQKVDAITTYKWFRQQKGLVFISFEADSIVLFNGDFLNASAEVDNTFGHVKIQSAKILFYLEFIIKERLIQGMPKILLCEKLLEENQNKYYGQMNFQITDKLNLPNQSVSERIGCRYIVVLQLIFQQLCMGSGVDNVEFILPYMEYYRDNKDNIEPQLECLTEIKNIENFNKLMDARQNVISERQTKFINDQEFLMNRKTRVAQLNQILIMKD